MCDSHAQGLSQIGGYTLGLDTIAARKKASFESKRRFKCSLEYRASHYKEGLNVP